MNDNNLFQNAFDAIDDELIADAKNPSIRIAARRKKIMISSIAACVAAILVAIPSVKILGDLDDNKITTSEDTEKVVEEIIIEGIDDTPSKPSSSETQEPSKSQSTDDPTNNISSDTTSKDALTTTPKTYDKLTIDDMPFANNNVGSLSNGSTKSYDKVYVPDIKYLYVTPVPTDEYITFYNMKSEFDNPPSESTARAYLDSFLPKLAVAFQIPTPQYTLKNESYMDAGEYGTYIVLNDKNSYSLFFNHLKLNNEIKLSHSNMTFEEDLTIDGQKITIDHTKSDKKIIESLSMVKQQLFDIFGVAFDDAKIIRNYGEIYGDIYVYFYKQNDTTRGSTADNHPTTDYIKIRFSGNMVENSLLNGSDVNCKISRATKTTFVEGDSFKLMPLKKAEEYLYKGYVFGGPGCPLCRQNQESVNFQGYDYVGISYSYSFPCYTFYKYLGTTETEIMCYAKTYVPAVEVEGYEEYFINKHANH